MNTRLPHTEGNGMHPEGPVLPLSGSSLGQVKHLPGVQVPHERLDDLSSLRGGVQYNKDSKLNVI